MGLLKKTGPIYVGGKKLAQPILVWQRGAPFLHAYSTKELADSHSSEGDLGKFPVFNEVRNELGVGRNARRLLEKSEVVSTSPMGKNKSVPYMPRPFPKGIWKITDIMIHGEEEEYLCPYFLVTDAWQWVTRWVLDPVTGGYLRDSGEQVKDTAYGLHSSNSRTTLGCLRVGAERDRTHIEALVKLIRPFIDQKISIELRVL